MKKSILALPLLFITATAPLYAQETAAPAEEPVTGDNKPISLPDPVATIDGEKISRADIQKHFDKVLEGAGREVSSLTPDQQLTGYHTILDDMLLEKILDKKVVDIKVSDEEIDTGLAEIRSQFKTEEAMDEQLKKAGQTTETVRAAVKSGIQKQKWVDAQIADKIVVTEEDSQELYKSRPEAFLAPDQVRASHILILTPEGLSEAEIAEKKKAIEAVAVRLKKGEDFATVAKEVSEDPGSKDKGGDLEFFAKEAMVPEFSEVAFSLEPGKLSDPVKSQFGYHIIKVTEKKAGHTVPFAEANAKITEYLIDQKRRAAVEKLVVEIRGSADIKIMLPPLPKPPVEAEAEAAPAPKAGS